MTLHRNRLLPGLPWTLSGRTRGHGLRERQSKNLTHLVNREPLKVTTQLPHFQRRFSPRRQTAVQGAGTECGKARNGNAPHSRIWGDCLLWSTVFASAQHFPPALRRAAVFPDFHNCRYTFTPRFDSLTTAPGGPNPSCFYPSSQLFP